MVQPVLQAPMLSGWLPALEQPRWLPNNREPAVWPDVAIIVPARNEADILPQSLPSLLKQDYPGRWKIILVDDHSTDNTAQIAYRIAQECGQEEKLQIFQPPALPAGWSGKVHAMHWGVQTAGAVDYALFTDADIFHQPSSLRFLVSRSVDSRLDLHSLMVKLRCQSLWEKLLIPAFVYFFQMLYPFDWSNHPAMRTAAAAGGVMLVNRNALESIGGMEAIKGALIDDCALARAIKFRPGADEPRIWLSLVDHAVVSLRAYDTLDTLWQMISRAAFTQLRYSWLLLLGTTLGMSLIFILPFFLPFMGGLYALTGFVLLAVMLYSYLPMVSFYRLNFLWAATLPAAALIYLGATLDSARRYALGKGGAWKGRTQANAG